MKMPSTVKEATARPYCSKGPSRAFGQHRRSAAPCLQASPTPAPPAAYRCARHRARRPAGVHRRVLPEGHGLADECREQLAAGDDLHAQRAVQPAGACTHLHAAAAPVKHSSGARRIKYSPPSTVRRPSEGRRPSPSRSTAKTPHHGRRLPPTRQGCAVRHLCARRGAGLKHGLSGRISKPGRPFPNSPIQGSPLLALSRPTCGRRRVEHCRHK